VARLLRQALPDAVLPSLPGVADPVRIRAVQESAHRLAAASAAKTFQPTRSRQEADAALASLETYYRDLASAAPAGFDVQEAARLELDWWQARREKVTPSDYGVTVARVAAITYGKPADVPAILRSGIARAEAMAYRDARGQAMAEADWLEIERQLLRAYQDLKTAVAAAGG